MAGFSDNHAPNWLSHHAVPFRNMGEVVALRPLRGGDEVLALDALENWLAEYAGVGGRSDASVDSQRRHVRATLAYVAADANSSVDELLLDSCTRDAVVAALLAYRSAPDARFTTNPGKASVWKSDESVRRRASALRTFFGWCVRTGRMLRDPTLTLETPRAKPALPKAFTEEEARRSSRLRWMARGQHATSP